jgi:hypothetical protein
LAAVTAKENWTREHWDQQLAEMRRPVEELLKRATEGWRAATIAEWTWEVCMIVPDAQERVDEVLEEKSMDYSLEELNFLMQKFGTWSQRWTSCW